MRSYDNLDAIQALMNRIADRAAATKPFATIVFGSDPPDHGICMIQNGGMPSETHLNHGQLYTLPVLINGKHEDQHTLLETLGAIHEALTRIWDTDFADSMVGQAIVGGADVDMSGPESLSDDRIQVVNIETTAFPSILGREQNLQWISGSSINVYFYWR